jgi:hypothetical protein
MQLLHSLPKFDRHCLFQLSTLEQSKSSEAKTNNPKDTRSLDVFKYLLLFVVGLLVAEDRYVDLAWI